MPETKTDERGVERVAVFLTPLEWWTVRDALAAEHNRLLKRKSGRPSERAMHGAVLRECIGAIETEVPSTKPG